jgi:hypothetical protein
VFGLEFWSQSKTRLETSSRKRPCRSRRTSSSGRSVAMLEVNAKTDLKIKLVSIEPLKHESLEEKMLARRGGSNL